MNRKDQNNWEKARGVLCSECQNETLQIVDGLCRRCYERKAADYQTRVENEIMKRYFSRGFLCSFLHGFFSHFNPLSCLISS